MRHTFTYRQLREAPGIADGMERLWQDSDAKTVTFEEKPQEPVSDLKTELVKKVTARKRKKGA